MAVEPLGKFLIYVGIIMVLIGGFFVLVAKVPWFGKLPGDFIFRREGITIFFPVATMVLVSLILTLLLNIIWKR